MKSIRNSRWFFAFILIATSLAGCAEQTPAVPTAAPTTPVTATPTPVPYVDITKPVKVDGAELWFIQATDDTSLYDSGPFSVQHADDVTVLHIEAEIVSGNIDLETFQDGILLFDENGEDLAMISYSVEEPFWEFLVPITSKSFILQLPDGQLVKLDPILNLLAGGTPGAAAQPTVANTPIPSTPEPSILIQLGPGKFGKAMWLDVLKGDYQIVGGSTLLTGSSIGVNEDWMNFPPGLAIDVIGTSVTLKGTVYPDGSKLLVDSSGNLISRGAADPSANSIQDYLIPAGIFSLDTRDDCNTNASIEGVDDRGFNASGTISMHNDRFVLWCPGARHTWEGTLTYEGYTFDSDADDPLVFVVDSQGGYEYISGKGRVTQPDGKAISLSTKAGAAVKPAIKPTVKPSAVPTAIPAMMKKNIFPTVFLSEPFDNNAAQWPTGDVDGPWWTGTRLIKNGVLDWDGKSKINMNSSVSPDNPSLINACASQELNVRVKALNPAMGGSFGLRLMSPDDTISYAFLLDPNGYFAFYLIEEEAWTPLIDWEISPHMNVGDWNKLSIQAERSHFKLFINDKLAGELDDSTIPSRQAGLIITANEAGERIQIQFDDFEIRLPATEQAAGCPLEISTEMDDRFSEVLISDNFDDNSSEWPLGDVDIVYWKGSRSIENGVLEWKGVSRSPMSWYVIPDTTIVPGNQSDQLTSVSVKLVNPNMDGTYGLVVRSKELMEGSRFYVFLLDPTGYVSFFLNSKDEWTPLLDWQEIPGVNPGDWNKLSVEALGTHFRLFLNDTLVGEVDDATLKSGPSGVIIETYNSSVSFDVQFDDFIILLPGS